MSTFEYLAVLISIVVGLAVTHILQAIGRAVSRPGSQKLFWVHSLWVIYALGQVMLFWWFQLGYRVVDDWTAAKYSFVVCYAIALYLECVILVPDDPESDYRAYYFRRKNWILGVMAAVWLIDAVDSFLKPTGMERFLQSPVAFAGQYVVTWGLLASAMATRKVWYHGLVAALMVLSVFMALVIFPEVGR